MNAREVKDALRRRHPAYDAGLQGPGQWTCIEEWEQIDLLAFNAWGSGGPRYGRVGYEVKVSRADYKRELLKPYKRARAVAFCHQFYFAVPAGLLKEDEIAWREPEGGLGDEPFRPMRCPGAYGAACVSGHIRFGVIDRRTDGERYANIYGKVDYARAYSGPCPTCRGEGSLAPSPAVLVGAPKLWVPSDVGLIEVTASGTRIARNAPRRVPEVGLLGYDPDRALSNLVRFVSFRPDPRHATRAA